MHDIDYQLQYMLLGEFEKGWEISERLESLGIEGMPLLPGKTKEELWIRHCFNRGWFFLRKGNYGLGCQLLEWGRHINNYGGSYLVTAAPIYNPSIHSLKDKSIIIALEGGLGDEIIYARFAQIYRSLGASHVYLAASPQLVSVLNRVPGVDRAISRDQVHTVIHDYWIPGFSTGWVAGCTYETLPNDPYIAASPLYRDKWKKIISSDKIKVGIRWAGNPEFEHQQFRRFPAAYMLQLSQYTGIQFYSLQRDTDLKELPFEIQDLNPHLETWEDTAAAIEQLDLVISSCTSVAHLSGALGIPTWVVVPILPYHVWSYGAPHNTSSPFYKTVTLFRQKKPHQWLETFQDLYRALSEKFQLPLVEVVDYEKTSPETKELADISNYLAKNLYGLKKYREAIEQNKITLSLLTTESLDVYKNISDCYRELGDNLKSLEYLERYNHKV